MATRPGFLRNLSDLNMTNLAFALPAAGTATLNSAGFSLGPNLLTPEGEYPEGLQLVVVTPAFTTTQLPNAQTLTLQFQASNDPNFGSGVVSIGPAFVVTGAGGVGAAANEYRADVPRNLQLQYVRLQAVTSATAAIGAAITVDFRMVI